MTTPSPGEPNRLHPAPLPLTPLWSRRWVGFPAAPPPIGRDAEVAVLRDLLLQSTRRIVTVTGPGGVGKTRLALAVAEALAAKFTDGGAFVALASVSDPALVLPTIARALEVRETPGRSPREALLGVLRDRHLLLVLDNFEHLAGQAAAADVAALIAACPALTVLVTSRTPLHLHDEQLFATPALDLPPAVGATDPATLAATGAIALFLDRARLVRPGFSLTAENADPVVEICRRLDGLPLAIELAAAWLRVLPPAALLARLQPPLPLLRGGRADQPPRLRTMRDAIAWSYDRLREDEQRLFRRLAIFVGGFTLEAAEWVVGDRLPVAGTAGPAPNGGPRPTTHHPQSTTLDLVAALLDKSLLLQLDASCAESRFIMLETIREFALEQLAVSGEAAATAAAHAAHVRDLAERAEPELLGPEEQLWQRRIDADLGNVRAALAWALDHDVEAALRIAASLWVYWSIDHLAEGRQWLCAALECSVAIPDCVRARAMTTEAALACLLGDFAVSDAAASAAADLAARAGDRLWEARARWIIGASRWLTGDAKGAVSELDRALVLFAGTTTASGHAHAAYAAWNRAVVAITAGEVEQGLGIFERALEMVR